MDDRDNEQEENLLADMLEDFSNLSGIDFGEILADQPEDEFEEFPVHDEPTESEELDLDNDYGSDVDDYFDNLFDDIDVDIDSEEGYGDE